MDISKKVWLGEAQEYVSDRIESLTRVQEVGSSEAIDPCVSTVFINTGYSANTIAAAPCDGHVLHIVKVSNDAAGIVCAGGLILNFSNSSLHDGCIIVWSDTSNAWNMVGTNGVTATYS